MALVRLNFRNLTLFEDEEAGDTHMAMYATVRDNVGGVVATFRWNNAGAKVNETNTYSLDNDPSNPSVVDVKLPGVSTIGIECYADDDQDWPTSGSNENALGNASVTFDSRVTSTLGSLPSVPLRPITATPATRSQTAAPVNCNRFLRAYPYSDPSGKNRTRDKRESSASL